MLVAMGGEYADEHIKHIFTREIFGETEINGVIFTPDELEIFVEPKIRKEYLLFLWRKRFNKICRQIFHEDNEKKIEQKKQTQKYILTKCKNLSK